MKNTNIKNFESEIDELVDKFQSTEIEYDEVSITAETSLFEIAKVLARIKAVLGNDG